MFSIDGEDVLTLLEAGSQVDAAAFRTFQGRVLELAELRDRLADRAKPKELKWAKKQLKRVRPLLLESTAALLQSALDQADLQRAHKLAGGICRAAESTARQVLEETFEPSFQRGRTWLCRELRDRSVAWMAQHGVQLALNDVLVGFSDLWLPHQLYRKLSVHIVIPKLAFSSAQQQGAFHAREAKEGRHPFPSYDGKIYKGDRVMRGPYQSKGYRAERAFRPLIPYDLDGNPLPPTIELVRSFMLTDTANCHFLPDVSLEGLDTQAVTPPTQAQPKAKGKPKKKQAKKRAAAVYVPIKSQLSRDEAAQLLGMIQGWLEEAKLVTPFDKLELEHFRVQCTAREVLIKAKHTKLCLKSGEQHKSSSPTSR